MCPFTRGLPTWKNQYIFKKIKSLLITTREILFNLMQTELKN